VEKANQGGFIGQPMSEEIEEGDSPTLEIEEDGLDVIRCPHCGCVLHYVKILLHPDDLDFTRLSSKRWAEWLGVRLYCESCHRFFSPKQFESVGSQSPEQIKGKQKLPSKKQMYEIRRRYNHRFEKEIISRTGIIDNNPEEVQESLLEDEGDEGGEEKEDEVHSDMLTEVDDHQVAICINPVGFPCHEPPESPTEEHLWWYVSMDSKQFGIHLNVEAFEMKVISAESSESFFRMGYLHEYFHHIVDSWRSEGKVSRKLSKRYGKQWRKEVNQGKRPFLLIEEVLANAFAFGGERGKFKFPKDSAKSSYDLWPSLMEFRKIRGDEKLDWEIASAMNSDNNIIGINKYRWKELSIIIALQYLLEDYTVDDSMPRNGFTLKELRGFLSSGHELESNLPKNKYFNIYDGFSFIGKFPLTEIPFHTHGKSNGIINYDNLVSLMGNSAPTEFSLDSPGYSAPMD
jgi:hypothetical protein